MEVEFLTLEIFKFTFRDAFGRGFYPARSFLSFQADAQFLQVLDHLAVVLILVL